MKITKRTPKGKRVWKGRCHQKCPERKSMNIEDLDLEAAAVSAENWKEKADGAKCGKYFVSPNGFT